jgi:large subunit ribosomal protein L10
MMDRATKGKLKETFDKKVGDASTIVMAEYRGMTVEQLTKLRRELRSVNAEFKVTKNRIAKLAIVGDQESKFVVAKDRLKGPIGVVFVYGDAAPVAKKLLDFAGENEKFIVRSGVMEGKEISHDDLKAISNLPTREVLMAQIMGLIQAPARNLVGTLAAVVRNVVQVSAAVRDTKK